MASSNRHWPSMFRSNPAACDLQQQPDMSSSRSSSSSSLLLPSNGGHGSGKPSSLLSSGIEESGRSPEPKPRWNPRPEQIRILEGIFNSGVVNPPRDEIRRIRLQLQEYGQVGDANVFYWFQNRKSRTKHKLRASLAARTPSLTAAAVPPRAAAPAPVTPPRHLLASPLAPTSSSSSSSDRSSGSSKSVKPAAALTSAAAASQGMLPPSTGMHLFTPTPAPSPAAMSATQLYYQHPMPAARELLAFHEPLLLPQWPQSQYLPATELGGVLGSHAHTPAMHPASVARGMLLGLCDDVLGHDAADRTSCPTSKKAFAAHHYLDATASMSDAVSTVLRDDEKAMLGLLHYGLGFPAASPLHGAAAADSISPAVLPIVPPINAAAAAAVTSSSLNDQLQGLLDAGLIGGAPPTATVVALQAAAAGGAARDSSSASAAQYYSVPAMARLDVKQFGEAAVLLRHTGEHVLVDHAGVTVEPLQQGAVYYVLVASW